MPPIFKPPRLCARCGKPAARWFLLEDLLDGQEASLVCRCAQCAQWWSGIGHVAETSFEEAEQLDLLRQVHRS